MFFFVSMKAQFHFPQYRRMVNGKSWYVVEAEDYMKEYQVLGSRVLMHELKATIMPERWAIADVLTCENMSWEVVSKEDFQAFLAKYNLSA